MTRWLAPTPLTEILDGHGVLPGPDTSCAMMGTARSGSVTASILATLDMSKHF
jgi:hypothetical protein